MSRFAIKWPDALVSDLARRRSVIVLGSGISRQSQNAQGIRPKMWGEFLQTALDQTLGSGAFKKSIRKLFGDGDFLTACEIIKQKMGDSAFRELIRKEFLAPAFAHAPIHDAIIDLDSRITATPNFDKIFETRINTLQHGSVAVKPYYDDDMADIIRSPNRVVIKIHGSVDRPAEMIFTRTEYARARYKYNSFYSLLQSLIVTNTFLFLGCGLNDPDIRLLLEEYAFQHSFSRPHYFVLPQKQIHPDHLGAIEQALNIKILEYDSANQHEQLKHNIESLRDLVNTKRLELAGTHQW